MSEHQSLPKNVMLNW